MVILSLWQQQHIFCWKQIQYVLPLEQNIFVTTTPRVSWQSVNHSSLWLQSYLLQTSMVECLLYIHSSQFTHHDGAHEYFIGINGILFVCQWNSFDIGKYISNKPVDGINVNILTRVALSLAGLSCKYWHPISYNSATHCLRFLSTFWRTINQ